MIKISVIMPVYNGEDYLEDALDSVLIQSLNEIEVICINDGSTDNSENILRKYEEKYTAVHVISHANMGAGASRNKGISVSCGEYITFLDADDCYPNEFVLQHLYYSAKDNKAKICGGNQALFETEWKGPQQVSRDEIVSFHEDGFVSFFDFGWPFGYQRYIYEREMITDNKIEFPTYTLVEDATFFCKAMTVARSFYGIAEDTYAYRIGLHDASRRLMYVHNYLIMTLELMEVAHQSENLRLQEILIYQLTYDEMYGKIIRLMNDERDFVFDYLERISQFVLPKLRDKYEENLGIRTIIENGQNYVKRMQEIKTLVNENHNVIIYGAGKKGRRFAQLMKEEWNIEPLGFAVSVLDGEEHYDLLYDIKEIDCWENEKESALFVIAVFDSVAQNEMYERLIQFGAKNTYLLHTECIEAAFPLEV